MIIRFLSQIPSSLPSVLPFILPLIFPEMGSLPLNCICFLIDAAVCWPWWMKWSREDPARMEANWKIVCGRYIIHFGAELLAGLLSMLLPESIRKVARLFLAPVCQILLDMIAKHTTRHGTAEANRSTQSERAADHAEDDVSASEGAERDNTDSAETDFED